MVYNLFAYTAGFLLLVLWWAFLCLWFTRHAGCNFLFLYCSCFVLSIRVKMALWYKSGSIPTSSILWKSLWKIIISLFIQEFSGFPHGSGEGNGNSSVFAWRSPWMEEPGRLESMESQRVSHNWVTNTYTHTHS